MGSGWRFEKGTGEASSPVGLWRTVGFADAAFVDAPAPFWYGDVRAGGTQLTEMRDNYSCVYLRHTFVIGDPGAVSALDMTAIVDDGFIAWINGIEVQRVNMNPGEPTYQTLGVYNGNHPDPAVAFDYSLPAPGGYLVPGTNVLAVQAFNASLSGSSDFSFDCSLEATIVETTTPVVSSVDPPPGEVSTLTMVQVTFSEPVVGVDSADLRINGNPCISVSGFGDSYTFAIEQVSEGTVTVSWAAGHGITDLAIPANPFNAAGPGASWQYTLVDTVPPGVALLFPADGAAIATLGQIEVTFDEPVLGVGAGDLLINGSSATNLVKVPAGPYVFSFPEPATGQVAVVWAAGHGITDAAATPNAFAGGAWSYTLDPSLPASDLVITEILASNIDSNGLVDADGELQDWIEIYNRGTQTVDLADWSLSDDPAIPGLWPFPARTLDPGEFLVVFASGKDRKPLTGELHTVFKLSGAGEHLGLYTPDSPRILAGGFADYPEQRNDASYGVDPDGELRYFATPTPGAPNGASTIVGVVEPIHVNVQRGYFTNPFQLILSCETPGAILHYTTDGSEPTIRHPVFPGTLNISATTLFRAAGFKADCLPAKTITHSYLFNLPDSIRSLPIVSIVTDQQHLTGSNGIINPANFTSAHGLAWERPTSVEWIEPEDNSGFQIDCGIRLQGSDYNRQNSNAGSKLSYRLYFRGDYGPGRLNYRLFPSTTVDRFDQLVLRAGFNEQSDPFIRDEIHRRLSHDMGQIASHGNLAVVFVNGEYYQDPSQPWILPVYNPTERVHEEFFQEHLGGGDEWDVVKPPWQQGGGAVDGTFQDMQDLVNYTRFSANPSNAGDYTTIGQWMDLTNFVDYVMLNTYAAMGDWPGNNWRAGRDIGPDGIWRWCLWDAEWGMGIYDRTVNINSFTLSGGGPSDSGLSGQTEIGFIFQGLKPSAEFRLLWADRAQKHFHQGGALTRENITNRFVELQTELSAFLPGMETEILDWARDRQPIYFSQLTGQGLLSTLAAPTFGQHGGRIPAGFALSMSAPAGTIYYTIDGSDPRVKFTGAVSGSARTYGSPVGLGASVTVRARAKQGATWSALTEATFTFEELGIPLRITEIMYNPVGGSPYEYLEILNTSLGAVDLGGMYLDGISFIFNQGSILAGRERLVLGSNTDTNAWKARYGGLTAFGWFAGNLGNGGERIALYDRDGNVVTSVDYGDGGGWPEAADGAGGALEVLDANGDPDDPANWQGVGSTPGAANSTPPAQVVYLNEVVADNQGAVSNGGTYPDWVEIRNPGGSLVDLGGWSLSDDGDERKYVLPAGTTVPGTGYLVVWCDAATNTTSGLHAGFSLDNDGETVSLYDPSTTRIDAVSFGLQIADTSVGRIGGDWTLTTPTLGTGNTAATLGAASNLGINEWMADPMPGEDDWIELYNRSATLPVALKGIYLGAGNAISRLPALSYLAPQGHAQIRADEGVGPDHVDFKLPAIGGQVALYDATGAPVEQVVYGLQIENVSQGRLPDGNTNLTSFPGSASPGAMNYVSTYTGPVINEMLARNTLVELGGGVIADYVEIRNPAGASFDLGGMSLSVNRAEAGSWIFPTGTLLGAGGHLVIRCDDSRAASTTPGSFNLGKSLDGESGGAYLFNPANQLVDSVTYGLQVKNLPIGLSSGQWKLLSAPTPGTANPSAAALGSSTALVINEWMADPAGGADWFELYNPLSLPVDLAAVSLSDDPSLAGEAKFLPDPLSFIGAGGFVKWVADANPGEGRNHVNFGLDGQGDSLLVYRNNGGGSFTLIDAVAFGAQAEGISAGSLPDGSVSVIPFPGSASPAAGNYRLLSQVLINEILTHTDAPFEDAVELFNPTGAAIDLGGWYLSNSADNLTKYQIPNGVTIPAGGYVAIYEYQFNGGGADAFDLNSAHGDQVWLSKAPGGVETGDRVMVEVGASLNGVSFGRLVTSDSVDYPALVQTSFGVSHPTDLAHFRTGTGATNAAPVVGPVIINEIFYHPPGGTNGTHEYIELHNNSGSPVDLFDPAYPTNRWTLGGGIDYRFPPGVSLGIGTYLLVVDFDPVSDLVALAAFRNRYGISASVPVYGPFAGNLDNGGEEVVLYRPDTPQQPPSPDAGFVPYVIADRVDYDNASPWPLGLVDGGGHALQRRAPSHYGNEPLNWFSGTPTPGTANMLSPLDSDGDGIPDDVEDAMGLDSGNPDDGAADSDGDGASNYEEYVAGTGHLDPNSYLRLIGVAIGTQTVLTFDAVAGKTYSVFYTDVLPTATWSRLADVPAPTIDRTEGIVDDTFAPTRFYLLVTPSAP